MSCLPLLFCTVMLIKANYRVACECLLSRIRDCQHPAVEPLTSVNERGDAAGVICLRAEGSSIYNFPKYYD